MGAPILFPDFAPDLTPLGTGVSAEILNVLPQGDGYGPFKSFVDFTQALPSGCRGYTFARNDDGSISIFAGTETRLYKLNNTTFAWDDVSQGATDYPTLVTTANWRFAQFGDLVIATQINTVPQKYSLSGGGTFVDLGGSPPQAGHIAIINGFVVLTQLLSDPRRVQWSDLFAPEVWTAGVGLSDYQDMADGGTTHGVSGGDRFGLLFQDDLVRSLTYAPGSSTTFQITKVSENDTLFAEYSVVAVGNRVFYISAQGFKMYVAGGDGSIPIGKERIDKFFFENVDRSSLRLVIGAVDPAGTRVFFAFKSLAGSENLFDKVLCYDWSIGKGGKWSILNISGQWLGLLVRPGLTLEALDAIAPGALQVLGAANNGSGAIRLTLNATSNAYFDIAGQNFIVVQGVVGTTEANGAWEVTIVDPTHIDLIGSTFVNAYVSGGAIGGSLDALPFSLDSFALSTIAQLGACGPTGMLGFFTGDNLEAVLETDEQDGEGAMAFVGEGLRPLTDSADVVASIGYRNLPSDDVTYNDESALAFTGLCPMTLEARYMRGRIRIPAGSTWRYARGLQVDPQAAGVA